MIGEAFASGTMPLPTDTLRVIEEKILLALRGAGGGGGGGGIPSTGFLMTYILNPNTEGVTPANISNGAIAYQQPYVDQPIYQWDTTNHVWI